MRAESEGRGAAKVEDLYAVVARVGHRHHAVRRGIRDGPRRVELRIAVAVRAELACQGAVGVEHLDAVVERVGHRERAGRRDGGRGRRRKCDVLRVHEGPVGGADRPERACQRAVGVEGLYEAVVLGHGNHLAGRRVGGRVGTPDVPPAELVDEGAVGADDPDAAAIVVCRGHPAPGRVKGGRVWRMVLVGAMPPRSKLAGKGAVRVEEVDAVVSPVCHCNAVAGRGVVDRPGPPAVPAGGCGGGGRRAEPEDKLAAGGIEDLDAAVAMVGHGDPVAVWGVCDGQRIAELPVGGAGVWPADLEGKGSVWVEHLYAVVEGVRHGDPVAGRGVCRRVRIFELPVAAAKRAERMVEHAVGVEYLDAVVAAVDHGECPRQVDDRGDVGRGVGRRRGRRRVGVRRGVWL